MKLVDSTVQTKAADTATCQWCSRVFSSHVHTQILKPLKWGWPLIRTHVDWTNRKGSWWMLHTHKWSRVLGVHNGHFIGW